VFSDAVLSRIANEGLAEFCDVFFDTGAFDVAEARRVLTAAARYGLKPRVHADQIAQIGASRLAAEITARSADHLERVDDESIAALKAAGTVAVLLPGCSLFLGVEQAPARGLLDADLPVALATDLNPGSSMIESLPLVMSLACTQMRMTPAEALVAATANAAAVLDRAGQIGTLSTGFAADLVILDVADYREWAYNVGRNCAATVIKRGQVVVGSQQ
jgi:imidazolonepropionase